MATVKESVKEFLFEHQEGITKKDLAEEMETKSKSIHRELYRLAELKEAVLKDGVWYPIMKETADAAVDPSGLTPSHTPPQVEAPNLYDTFKSQGTAIGLMDPLLDGICRYVFQGDAEDLNWVWSAMRGMGLRPDALRRWYRMWSMSLDQPIPESVKKAIGAIEDEERKKKGEDLGAPRKMKYTVAGDKIFPDPDGDFDSPMEASRFMAMNNVNKPSSGVQDLAAIMSAVAEMNKNQQGPILDVAAMMTAMRPEPKDNSELIAIFTMMMENQRLLLQGSGEPKESGLDKFFKFAQTPGALPGMVGMAKKFLGLDALEAAVIKQAQAGNNPMFKMGENGMALNLADWKDMMGFMAGQKREEAEDKRKAEAHAAKLGVWDDIRKEAPKVLGAAERAVRKMEERGPTNPPVDNPPKRQRKPQTLLEGPCPGCGNTVRAPIENPIAQCESCNMPVRLTQQTDSPFNPGGGLAEEEMEKE